MLRTLRVPSMRVRLVSRTVVMALKTELAPSSSTVAALPMEVTTGLLLSSKREEAPAI